MDQALSASRTRTKSFWQTGFPKVDAGIKIFFSLGLPAGLVIYILFRIVIPITDCNLDNSKQVPIKVEAVKEAVTKEGERTREVIWKNGRETHDKLDSMNDHQDKTNALLGDILKHLKGE